MIAGEKPSIIDNIFINIFEKAINSGDLINKIMDHLPNFLFLADFTDIQKKQGIRMRDMKGFNQKTFIEDLNTFETLNFVNFPYVNELHNVFHSKLLAAIDKNVPYKALSKQQQQQQKKLKPLSKKIIIKSIKMKNIYFEKFVKRHSEFWYSNYKYHRSIIKYYKSKNNLTIWIKMRQMISITFLKN